LSHENLPAVKLGYVAVVVPSTYLEMRPAQGVEAQIGEKLLITGQVCVLKNAGRVRIRDNGLDDGITPVWIRVCTTVS
jgi:hypothetical protein